MARIETDPNYTSPTFSRATAATDLFKKEDVQNLAAAVSTHDHSTGKGLTIPFATSIPNGTITSAMIADGTIVAGDIADGAITSAKILDGTIATADLANASVTNAKLASDTARLNLLTNGGFEVWQRGNGPFTGGVWGPDRWGQTPVGTDTLSVSRDAGNVDVLSTAAAACTFTLGTGAGATQMYQNCSVAGGDYLWARGATVTFSVRVRTATASAVRIGLNNYYASTSHYTYSSFHTGGGTWQTLTVTATMDSALQIMQLAILFAASCVAYVDNAMLVLGSQAADYAPLHPADETARCLRYYEVIGGQGNGIPQLYSYGAAGQQASFAMSFNARKAVTPTVTVGGAWGVSNCAAPGSIANTAAATLYTTVTALGAFNFNSVSGASFIYEANP